jgi:hypothetical protein
MKDFVAKLLSNNVTAAKNILDERLKNLVNEKLDQIKMRLVTEMFEDIGVDVELEFEPLDEANVQKMGRTKLIKVRIRKGKIQRRKKLSSVKGYTFRGGKMVRMSAAERRHRKMAARRSKFKRRAKLQQSLRKRRMSLRKRRTMGI